MTTVQNKLINSAGFSPIETIANNPTFVIQNATQLWFSHNLNSEERAIRPVIVKDSVLFENRFVDYLMITPEDAVFEFQIDGKVRLFVQGIESVCEIYK